MVFNKRQFKGSSPTKRRRVSLQIILLKHLNARYCSISKPSFDPRCFALADFQSCLICVARRVPIKERPAMSTYESFTTRQDIQGRTGVVLLLRHVISVVSIGTSWTAEKQHYRTALTSVLLSAGKITSLDTSLLRASMKPGWEDLVRRCIQRFHLQNDGEMSFAKKHQQDGESDILDLSLPSKPASML